MLARRLPFSKNLLNRFRKLGIWAFMFFLIKGLIWLAVAAWGIYKIS